SRPLQGAPDRRVGPRRAPPPRPRPPDGSPMSTPPPAPARQLRLVRLGLSEAYGVPQRLLCAVVILAPFVFLAAMILAGAGFTWWFLVLTPLAAVGAAR